MREHIGSKASRRPGNGKAIRIVLIDDHQIVLKGLEALLAGESDFVVVESCQSAEEGLDAVRRCRPDVAVVDIRLPGTLDGFGILRAMKREDLAVRTVLLTADIDDDQTLEAVRLGVQGIVLKEMAPQLLVQCIRSVHAGEQWLERRTVGRAMSMLLQRELTSREFSSVLTPREMEVVRMIAQGARTSSIADALHVSEGTVKTHLHHIYEKLGVDGRVRLILLAREKGLV